MLNIEQRAKRAAARKNNKLAKAYPLFAEQFAVTVESQVERLQKTDLSIDAFFEHLRNIERELYALAMERREICKAFMPADKFSEHDARAYRIFGTRGKLLLPEYAGSVYADWWWQAIRDYVPQYAQTHCPNSQFHEWKVYQAEGKCPTCKTRLTKRAPDVGDSARQLSFIQPQALSAPLALSQLAPRR